MTTYPNVSGHFDALSLFLFFIRYSFVELRPINSTRVIKIQKYRRMPDKMTLKKSSFLNLPQSRNYRGPPEVATVCELAAEPTHVRPVIGGH
jgi:hypothetical protein